MNAIAVPSLKGAKVRAISGIGQVFQQIKADHL
jgi:hypothetical protein